MNTNNIHTLFENQENWDLESPKFGHEDRFLKKLRKEHFKNNKTKWISISIAASLLLGFGFFFINYNSTNSNKVVFSSQVQQTHDYFSSVINSELATLKKQETPDSEVLVNDAMKQMNALENDYEKLKLEISKNGENKQIVYAMITNMQTRISFIKSVVDQVEIIKNLKNNNNENHI